MAACCLTRCALTDAEHALTDAAPHCCTRRICVPDAEAKEISSTYTATTPTPDSTQGLAGMLDSIVSGPFPVPFPRRRPLSAVPVAVPLAPPKPKEKTDFIPKEIPKVKNLRFRVEDGKAQLLWDVETKDG